MIIADSIGKYRICSNAYPGRTAGLYVDQKVVADNLLKTPHPDVFAAGDVLDFLVEEINSSIS